MRLGVEKGTLSASEGGIVELAKWVDFEGQGYINYLEFMEAFRFIDQGEGQDALMPRSEDACDDSVWGQMREGLCSFFFKHRWTMLRTFEYFDANGDGVTPDTPTPTPTPTLTPTPPYPTLTPPSPQLPHPPPPSQLPQPPPTSPSPLAPP